MKYGASKALAALFAAWLLGREFRRLGWDAEVAHSMVLAATVIGFAGAKLYYLAEHWEQLDHNTLSAGFTWYGGVIAATATVVVMAKRRGLPLGRLPVSPPYRCRSPTALAASDACSLVTGRRARRPTSPGGVTITAGMVPTDGPVHPTPLYEALAAFAIAALLWSLRKRVAPLAVFGSYLVLSGTARFLVEFVRTNDEALLGATQPQLWSLLLVAIGAALLIPQRRTPLQGPAAHDAAPAVPTPVGAASVR